jgi:hypothetical protein
MMDKVDKTGSAIINLHNHDTGSFPAEPSFYDVVTGIRFYIIFTTLIQR